MKRTIEETDDGRAPRAASADTNQRDTAAASFRVDGLAAYQQTLGNQAVARLARDEAIQAKLSVGDSDTPAEREAERVARALTSQDTVGEWTDDSDDAQSDSRDDLNHGPSTVVRSSATAGGSPRGGKLPAAVETIVRDGVRGSGAPIPEEIRETFGRRMGADLSDVRVHTDPTAHEAARSINAEAYTIGADVAFAKGNYDLGSRSGRRVLAHELTHVVQQTDAGDPTKVQRQATTTEDKSETAQGATQQDETGLQQESVSHEVQSGETLPAIAQRYGVQGGWRALWNYKDNRQEIGDNPNLIYPRDVIQVPATQTGEPEAGEQQPTAEGKSETEEQQPTTENDADGGAPDRGVAGAYQADNELTFRTSPGPLASIYFPTGKTELDSADQETLAKLDENLSRRMIELVFNPNYDSVRLEFIGYADKQQYAWGSDLRNQALSGKRAKSVKSALSGMSGYQRMIQFDPVSPATHISKGAVGPAPSEATNAELAQYRRVDVVLRPEGGKPKEEDDEGKDEDTPVPDDLPDQPPTGMPISDIISLGIQGLDTVANLAVLFGASMGWAFFTSILGMVAGTVLGPLAIKSAQDINKKAHGVAGYCFGGTEVLVNDTVDHVISSSGEFQSQYFFDGYTKDGGYYSGAESMQEELASIAANTADEREDAKSNIWAILKSDKSEDEKKAQIKAELQSMNEKARLYVMVDIYQKLDISEAPAEKIVNKLWDQSVGSRGGPGWDIWAQRNLVWWGGPGFEGEKMEWKQEK